MTTTASAVKSALQMWPFLTIKADGSLSGTGGEVVNGNTQRSTAETDALAKWRATGVPHFVVQVIALPVETPDPSTPPPTIKKLASFEAGGRS